MRGELLIIGGKEDKQGDKEILRHFNGMAGGKGAVIGILTTATKLPQEVGDEYAGIFRGLGAKAVELFHLDTRESAEQPEILERLKHCTGVFITGGDQVRLTSILGGTAFYDELRKRWQDEGLPLGGTSAGAAVMSCHMIMSAVETEEEYIVEMGAGFCFVDDVIIDQHFSQRARFNRLMTAIAHNPQIMGVGIDENTAIWVRDNGDRFSVLGEHSVTVFDGKKLEYTDTAGQGSHTNITVSGIRMHSLASGYHFDLKHRELIMSEIPGGEHHEGQ
ncbi:cyanophycinase [Paenibacillus sp. PK3_47]|uniref:cyanophycinase n=1 Tax=Paenibacillus sp. PK3_47 TaxID=2072642 RepID=UPI00201E0F98|nr:cyanophycinase [Paenibacillus sp. PK3_47]UQZ35577.1 cyanophycinase [Paenibacillus sp. PK3_47]